MTSFKGIADELKRGIVSPDVLEEYRNFCAGWLYTLHNNYALHKIHSAEWRSEHRKEFKSEAECEREWDVTPEGQKQIRAKELISGVEGLQDALKSSWFALQKEKSL